MIWPVALSFSGVDLDLAGRVAEALGRRRIGAYYYARELAEDAGKLLYRKHIEIYSTARVVGLMLRPDFMERRYPRLEYETVLARRDYPACCLFFVMEPGAGYLVPPRAAKADCWGDAGVLMAPEAFMADRLTEAAHRRPEGWR